MICSQGDSMQFKREFVEKLLCARYPKCNKRIQSRATEQWTVEETSPVTIRSQSGLPSEINEYTGTYDIPDLTVAEYIDASLVGYMPIGLYDNRIIPDTVQRCKDSFHHHLTESIEYNGLVETCIDAFQSNVLCTQSRQIEVAFPLVCTNGYYHWILEYLPKIRALREYEKRTGRHPIVLVRPDPPRWMKETLKEIGIAPSQYREWNGRGADIERLVTCTHHRVYKECSEPYPSNYQWLREQLVDTADSSFSTDEYIYISRDDAQTRRVRNKSDLMERLAEHSFKRYILSELTFAEQIQLFRDAKTVVGPHGAGLVNILFGDSLSVVELFPETLIRPYYYLLATVLNHDYKCVRCPAIKGTADISVEVDDVIYAVDAATG